VVAVAEASGSITTMGGVRISPDMLLDDLDPRSSDLLILPGAEIWEAGGGEAFAAAAARFLDGGPPVPQSAGRRRVWRALVCSTGATTSAPHVSI
jgi:hypothetical protein